MPNTTIAWQPNPAEEQIKNYKVYIDNAAIAQPTDPTFVTDLTPGQHKIEVSAVNDWGEGPKSDPISTPPSASKVGGLNVTVTVSVSVG